MSRQICITNNPLIQEICDAALFITGGPADVFLEARDLVHKGWKFVAHPQYGNFNPARHPYRTLVLTEPEGVSPSVDFESIDMLESALEKFREAGEVDSFNGPFDDDYAMLDRELTKSFVANI